MNNTPHKRHWSFIVCDKKYLYPLAFFIIAIGFFLSFIYNDPTHLNRIGSLIIGIGVWMSMRSTFRDGMNKYKNAQDSMPVINKNQLNSNNFNNITFSIGDAHLQIHGLILVIIGSIIGSYGDLLFSLFFTTTACE